jgi:hypothetical protein
MKNSWGITGSLVLNQWIYGVPMGTQTTLQAVLPRKDAWAKHPLCCELPREIRIREGKDSNCPIPSGKLPSRSELVKGLAEKRRLREDGGEKLDYLPLFWHGYMVINSEGFLYRKGFPVWDGCSMWG